MSCPHCGAQERLGVWLTPKKVVIFDRVKRAGDVGISFNEFGMSRHLFKAHVWQINALLEETDWKIRSKPGPASSYRLVRRHPA